MNESTTLENTTVDTLATRVLSVRLPSDDYVCEGCGRTECPCHLYMHRRADEPVDWEPVAAWYRARLHPDDRFLLGEYGETGDVRVELVLAPKSIQRKTFDRDRVQTPEEVIGTFAPQITVKKPKKVAARTEAKAEARDDVALKERPQDVAEFALTNPTEQDLKKMRRRR